MREIAQQKVWSFPYRFVLEASLPALSDIWSLEDLQVKKKKAEEKMIEASKKLKVLWCGQEEKQKSGERDFHVTEEKAKNVLAVNKKMEEECKSSKSRALLKSGMLEIQKCKSIW